MGREDRVLALIIDGEPDAADKSGMDTKNECFPHSLKYKVGLESDDRAERAEPIAADARREGDGKENAKLKLIAGLLGIGYDTLKRREVEARRARAEIWGAVVIAVMALFFAVIAYFLIGQTRDASAAQFVAEAKGDLAQRDYARAEIASAEALNYRDRPDIRELLFLSRLGGISVIARSIEGIPSVLNIFSRDGDVEATVVKSAANDRTTVVISYPDQHQELWRIVLPKTAGMPDSMAFSELAGTTRRIAISLAGQDPFRRSFMPACGSWRKTSRPLGSVSFFQRRIPQWAGTRNGFRAWHLPHQNPGSQPAAKMEEYASGICLGPSQN